MQVHVLGMIGFVYYFETILAKANFQIVGKGIECATESDLVANRSCGLSKKNTSPTWSIDVNFKENVEIQELFFKFSWFYKTSSDLKYKPFLGVKNMTINVCEYLLKGNSMIFDWFLEDVKKHSNLIHPCPFKGHCYVKQLSPNVRKFSAFICG